jgi:hypothetical protein
MTGIPRPALYLGFAGLIPFLWGALTVTFPGLDDFGRHNLGPRFSGIYLLNAYGIVILSFMSGVLWGFATRASGARAALAYALSVIPALWTFFMVGGGAEHAVKALIVGFLGLLLLDGAFWRMRLAPAWWMGLRLPLTAVVVASLAIALL